MPVSKCCEGCKKIFEVSPRRSESVRFCSRECKSVVGRIEHKCVVCATLFVRKRSEGEVVKFCSKACQYESMKGKVFHRPAEKKHFATCEFCAKSFQVTTTRKDTARFCSQKCQGESPVWRKECSDRQLGEKHWRWAGGKETKYVNSTSQRKHRAVVEAAMIAECPNHPFLFPNGEGVQKLLKTIEVHHIDRNGQNNE